MNNQRFDFIKYLAQQTKLLFFKFYESTKQHRFLQITNHIVIFCYSDILQTQSQKPEEISISESPQMYRQVKYTIKIQPYPQKNLRKNINALYVVLISDKDAHRIFSQPILVDSQRQNEIYSTNDIEYNRVELWNYDKMKLIEQKKAAFNMCEHFSFKCNVEEVTYSIVKSQVAKTTKAVDPVKAKQIINIGNLNGRKNSEGEYQNTQKCLKGDSSNKTESEQQPGSNIQNHKPPSIRIISVKQYHAY